MEDIQLESLILTNKQNTQEIQDSIDILIEQNAKNNNETELEAVILGNSKIKKSIDRGVKKLEETIKEIKPIENVSINNSKEISEDIVNKIDSLEIVIKGYIIERNKLSELKGKEYRENREKEKNTLISIKEDLIKSIDELSSSIPNPKDYSKALEDILDSVNDKIDISKIEKSLKNLESIKSDFTKDLIENDRVKVVLSDEQIKKIGDGINFPTYGGSTLDQKSIDNLEEIKTNTSNIDVRDTGEHCVSRDAKKIVGTNDTGVCERLATRADQTVTNSLLGYIQTNQETTHTWLETIWQSITSIYKAFLGSIALRDKKEDIGVLSLGTNFDPRNTGVATRKFQTLPSMIQDIRISSTNPVKINASALDPRDSPYLEISEFTIAGFNLSADSNLRIVLYLYDFSGYTFYPAWSGTIDLGSVVGSAVNMNVKFDTKPVASFDGDSTSYGFFLVTSLNGTPNFDFDCYLPMNVFRTF